MTILPEYLKSKPTEQGGVVDYRDWQIPLGRRFRSLKLWFVLRHYGVKGLQSLLRQHIAFAEDFEKMVEADPNFQLVVPRNLNLVVFRHCKGSDFTKKLHDRINESGKIMLTHTKVNGSYVIRFSIGQRRTDRDHIRSAWQEIITTAAELSSLDS